MARAADTVQEIQVRGGDLLILVALGTHEQPFERALDIVSSLAETHRLVIQHGHTPPRPSLLATWRDFVPYEEMIELLREADAVICHAGVGTILSALAAGKTPVVIPRLGQFDEHVDDHQLQITTAFEVRGFVVSCRNEGELQSALVRASRSGVRAASGDDALRRAVGAASRRK